MLHSFLSKLRWKFARFMYGRYGVDKMSTGIMGLGFFFFFISLFVFPTVFMSLYFLCILWFFSRCFSKNIVKRRNELFFYEKIMKRPRQFLKRQKNRLKDRKTHRYFKCKCGAFVKVPKGKGKIEISCRLCQRKMIRKT